MTTVYDLPRKGTGVFKKYETLNTKFTTTKYDNC